MNVSLTNRLACRSANLIGMMLIALGTSAAGGWLLDRPMTLLVGPDPLGMTFNAAISFILTGLALGLGRPHVRLALAVMTAVLGALTLCEYAFNRDLYIDRLFGTSWIVQAAPHPGRMAPQVAAAFTVAALALAQLTRPRGQRFDWIPPLAAGCVFLIAAVSLSGRLLRLDIVYDWHYANRIAPQTAAGLLLSSFGLALLTYRRSFSETDDVSNDARRILAVSTAAMLAITIACAAICFALVVRHSHDLQQAALRRELQNQVELIETEIAAQRHEADRVVSSQSLSEIMMRRSLRSDAQTPGTALTQALQAWGDYRLPRSRGVLALDVTNAAGQALLRSGSFGALPAIIVPLDDSTRIEIGAEARMTIERPLPPDASGRSGAMKMQLALPRLTALLQPEIPGHDFDSAICRAVTAHFMQCLQLSNSPSAGLPVARNAAGRPGAVNLAFGGKSGVTLGAGSDGARFFAAYSPIGATSLAMTLSTPLEALYSDLRQRLNVLLALMIGLVAAAAWLLRWQIAPLIAKIVAARSQLQYSESRYRDQATRLATVFDSVEDAIVSINDSGHVESWNLGAQHLFGYTAEAIIGKDVRLLLPEPDASAHPSQLLRHAQTGARTPTSKRIELEGRHASGRIVPIEMSVREMIIDGRRLYGAVIHDISVRREVERMKSEFVSTISHELRTPLTSIAGSLTLISGGAAGEMPPKIARLVGIARQNSERLIRLINDILDLEKAEAGMLDFQLSVHSLRAEVASVAEFNRGLAEGLGVAIELEGGHDADVLIDSDRLAQVLTNLISNAAKFSPPGDAVRIRIDRAAGGVRVQVTDRGPGIAPEFRARIFQKFAQADASDSRIRGGTGLGLSIAKAITEKLGGRIGFDSVPGEGTTFYIVLPIHSPSADSGPLSDWQGGDSIAATSAEEASGTLAQCGESLPQVLLVEDDPSLTAVISEAMSLNAVVTSARSLAAARQFLASRRFAAVILDVALPDGSGLELLPIVVADGERAPVVISYTADEPSRAWKSRVDVALVKSRHSVNQLLVTVLAHVDDEKISPVPPGGGDRSLNPRP